MDIDIEQKGPELKLSPLQMERLEYRPNLPQELERVTTLDFADVETLVCEPNMRMLFPHFIKVAKIKPTHREMEPKPLKVGVVLSGGQAAGGHNVVWGIFDALKELHSDSQLIGFLNGSGGIVRNRYKEITKELLANFKNQGGFDIIGSGRTKIETQEQFRAALNAVNENELDGLVVVGGDDSNTNAAFLAEYFKVFGSTCAVVGVPKTIDGDLQNDAIEIPFGFDTACKSYAETIGNIMRDCISAKKYYYFIKLMGRSASHITLECALKCQPNFTLIGEEILAKNIKLSDLVRQLVELVRERARHGLEYGVVLVPEGIVEFMPDIRELILVLNKLLAHGTQDFVTIERMLEPQDKIVFVLSKLTGQVQETYKGLPQDIQLQLLTDRDPHGNVQVSRIDSERLLMQLVSLQLKRVDPSMKFTGLGIFCGYEGRSALPSNFDATYCYSLGKLAAALVMRKRSGYIASIGHLSKPVEEWEVRATPLISMMTMEERDGKPKAVIKKALVELTSKAFLEFSRNRSSWKLTDKYCQVGPIQFFGPSEITDTVPLTVQLNRS